MGEHLHLPPGAAQKSGEPMELETMDYIRAMTYAILSNSMDWRCIAHDVDLRTGRLRNVDKALKVYLDNKQDLFGCI